MTEPLINIPPIKTKPPPPTTAATTTTTLSSSSSPRVTVSTPTTTTTTTSSTPFSTASRKIAIAVDLSEESAFAVKWAVNQYLRPGDAVFLVHIRPTSVLYGADWGCVDVDGGGGDREKLEEEFDAFTTAKAADLAKPLIDAQVPYKIHIVKDHDLKERLCLEVERLGFNAVIMGSRGFGASKKRSNDRLGSVSDYCVRHCVCPVVVVRYPDDKDGNVDDVMVSADKEGVALKDGKSHEAVGKRKDAA